MGGANDRLANLVRVRHDASGGGRAYHYEDARLQTLLTSITLEGKGEDGKPARRRYATYGYDAAGKAVLSTHANDAGKVQLAFERPGLTTVTNSLGQKTVYRYATIGGGFPQQDLAKIAMSWMVDQAKLAGVKIKEPDRTIIANPVLHDKSFNLMSDAPGGGPTDSSEDRNVNYGDGTTVRQRKQTSGLMTYADTTQFITYKPNPLSYDSISGTVDTKGYLAWLNEHGYNINMKVE
ncbi:MAG TPA: hypothetical protein VF774_19050 [Pseudoduganella sp.]|jgi:hypothetical protein